MFRRVDREAGSGRPRLAWVGLLVMVVSFVWLQLTSPRSEPKAAEPPANEAPFALVVLDPGHGGQDSGTMKSGMLEKELALDVAQRAERFLQLQGLATILTRTGDTYVSLEDRAAVANSQRNCVFVSIHFDNAARPAATGVETYYAAHQYLNLTGAGSWWPFRQRTSLESANVESQSLAAFVQEALVARTQAVNRGTTPQQFFVIAHVRHPAVLVEGGFLTNAQELNKLATVDYREQIAAAISDGVVRYREVLQQQRTPGAVDLPGSD